MKKGQKKTTYLIGGQWMTVPQIVEQPWCQVKKRATVYKRLEKGMGIVEAVTTKKNHTRKRYMYKGKLRSLSYLVSLPECAVCRATLYSRLENLNWPVEMAVTRPRLERNEVASKAWRKEKIWATPVEEIIARYGE